MLSSHPRYLSGLLKSSHPKILQKPQLAFALAVQHYGYLAGLLLSIMAILQLSKLYSALFCGFTEELSCTDPTKIQTVTEQPTTK